MDEREHAPFLKRVTEAISRIWSAREQLSIRNIRRSHIPYFLMLPFLLALLNMQNHYLYSPETLFGLDSLTMMYCACCVGIIATLVVKLRYWDALVRVFASSSLIFIALRLVLPEVLRFPALMVSWVGVGGCIGYAICTFVFVLNNTERLSAILLAAVSHGVYMCLLGFDVGGVFFTQALPIILALASALCVFMTKKDRIRPTGEKEKKPLHPAIRLSFPFFLTAFIIDSISSFVFTRNGYSLSFINGLGIFAAVILVMVIQLLFKQSVWHMWNLFYILAFTAHLLVLSQDPTLRAIAYFLHGMIYIGYVSVHYTIGGIHKKFSTLRGLRRGLILLFSILVPSLALLGYAEGRWPQAFTIATAAACCVSMLAFLLLSPSFQRYFFTSEQVDEYRSKDMEVVVRRLQEFKDSDEGESLSIANIGLSEDETNVAMLLIEGETPRDISRKLGMSASQIDYMISSILAKIGKGDPDPAIATIVRNYKLTRRETDILRCLRRNMTNSAMAAELYLSEETVRIHVRNLVKKLPVENRREVAAWVEGRT